MEKCKLCLVNDANDTGSHVVPHFLLKRIFNVAGAKGRDQELSFKLTTFDVESHFGRSVNPEKLDEVFGELTEEELEEKAMADLVVDNQWCTICEKKFADLENEYAATLATASANLYQSTEASLPALMFWLSIFWRASATYKLGFKMKAGEENILRQLLDASVYDGDGAAFIQKQAELLSQISYRLYRSPEYSKKGSTFLFMGHQTQPYSLMVDEFVILLYLRKKHQGNNLQLFFGFEKYTAAPFNTPGNGEQLYPLSQQEFSAGIENFVDFYKKIRLRVYDNLLNKLHTKSGNPGMMPQFIKDEIFQRITDDSTKIGRKYTMEDFVKCTAEVLSKY